jgi:hypothetical protein
VADALQSPRASLAGAVSVRGAWPMYSLAADADRDGHAPAVLDLTASDTEFLCLFNSTPALAVGEGTPSVVRDASSRADVPVCSCDTSVACAVVEWALADRQRTRCIAGLPVAAGRA